MFVACIAVAAFDKLIFVPFRLFFNVKFDAGGVNVHGIAAADDDDIADNDDADEIELLSFNFDVEPFVVAADCKLFTDVCVEGANCVVFVIDFNGLAGSK